VTPLTVAPRVTEVADLVRRLSGSEVGLYKWQERLLNESFLRGHIPQAVDIPTGLGKTKVITLWLIARAMGAPLPRRLVYVVDRRAVVDQATSEAQALAERLGEAFADEKLDAALRLRWSSNLGLVQTSTLAISTLRGQFIDNRNWLDRPHAAAIIVGTVDMIGSRLLFGGYGVSLGMRPAHAGLLGSDSLVVLDEAHLVPPFEQLVRTIAEFTEADSRRCNNIVPAFRVMSLSATGRDDASTDVFQLDPQDEVDPLLHNRLNAEKKLRLLDQVDASDLAKVLADRAWVLGKDGRRVITFCNSRKTAQAVEEDLAKRVKDEFGASARRTELFVGERRVRERLRMYDSPEGSSVFARFLPGAAVSADPVFLVATSAAEVGVDLDADDLVCDLVAWERMVQRFGRVNRRTLPGKARIEIIPSLGEKDAKDEIAVGRLHALRAPFEAPEWPCDDEGLRDASPLSLQRLKEKPQLAALIAEANSPSPFHPELSLALVQAWAMTTLRENPGRPLVQPWLRGWIEERPQTRVVWRRLLPVRRSAEKNEASARDLSAFFDAAPPHLTEVLEAPTDRIVEVFKKRSEAFRRGNERSADEDAKHLPILVVLDDRGEVAAIRTYEDIVSTKRQWLEREVAGRMVVVDARLGGLAESGLLDPKADDEPPTSDGDEGEWGLRLEKSTQWRILYGSRSETPKAWRFGGFRWSETPDIETSSELWVEVWRGAGATAGDPAITRMAQGLAEHHEWTRAEAEAIADGLCLSPGGKALLCAAAAYHDAGKNRDLWQNAMNASPSGRPFAKTSGGAIPSSLAGYRHEFGSLADAAHDGAIQALSEDDRDLALHLIAAHHGYSRPSITAFDPNRPPSASSSLAQQSALRYLRLQEKWGAWGLAWWEALLRASDWASSRRANQRGEPVDG
jgi:CRISPR-associated endonuclease/helicase Cas3